MAEFSREKRGTEKNYRNLFCADFQYAQKHILCRPSPHYFRPFWNTTSAGDVSKIMFISNSTDIYREKIKVKTFGKQFIIRVLLKVKKNIFTIIFFRLTSINIFAIFKYSLFSERWEMYSSETVRRSDVGKLEIRYTWKNMLLSCFVLCVH